MCHASGSEKHEIKDCNSKQHSKRNQIIERKLRETLEKYGEIKSMRARQEKNGRKENIRMASVAAEEQTKLAIKTIEKQISM